MTLGKDGMLGKDGNGLKLEKIGQFFSSFDAMSWKIIMVSWRWSCADKIHLRSS